MVNRINSSLPKFQKMATQLPKPNYISSRHTEVENSSETNTKTSKHREPNQKYRLGMVSYIKYYLSGGGALTGTQPHPQLLK